jgi:hypothetical protein
MLVYQRVTVPILDTLQKKNANKNFAGERR